MKSILLNGKYYLLDEDKLIAAYLQYIQYLDDLDRIDFTVNDLLGMYWDIKDAIFYTNVAEWYYESGLEP